MRWLWGFTQPCQEAQPEDTDVAAVRWRCRESNILTIILQEYLKKVSEKFCTKNCKPVSTALDQG